MRYSVYSDLCVWTHLHHAQVLGHGIFGRGLLRHGTVAHGWEQARVCNVDMKYNHGYYAAWHSQEIQECERVVYDQNDTKWATKKSVKSWSQSLDLLIHRECNVIHLLNYFTMLSYIFLSISIFCLCIFHYILRSVIVFFTCYIRLLVTTDCKLHQSQSSAV